MIAPGLASALPFLLVIGLFARLATLPLLAVAGVSTMHAVSNEHLCWVSLLLLIAAMGPGALSLDFLLAKALRRGGWAMPVSYGAWTHDLPQIVIVGGGFAGIAAARGLRFQRCAVTLVDRQNYHLFQPLLYQVATASLSPADIATPIRTLFRDQHNTRVLLGRVDGIDAEAKEVKLAGGARLRYDMLVLATGARHAYFGRDDWESYAPGLKTVENATEIRRRLLLAFEQAEAADDAAARQALLTFAVIGGGPTGVELAGAIAELARHGMAREFRNIDPAQARVLLVQAGDRLLPTFPASLSRAAARSLAALGVEVRLGAAVDSVDGAGITLAGTRIACRTSFWAAGVAASPAGVWIGADCDRAGRLKVNPDLTVPGRKEIFAVGDTAAVDAWDGKPVPGLAPAAKQSGLYAARVIAARLSARAVPPPFRYRHAGSLATIGRRSAVADFGAVRIAGPLAWWLWGGVHILFLAGTRNRAVVAVQWFWAYLTFGRGIRLITGMPAATTEPSM
jgi:NADH dehydrogenase FAD-containing subunit